MAAKTATPAATPTFVLWADQQSGRIACLAHGGAYLQAAVERRPRARTHTTPLGRWIGLTAADVAAEQAAAKGSWEVACEEAVYNGGATACTPA